MVAPALARPRPDGEGVGIRPNLGGAPVAAGTIPDTPRARARAAKGARPLRGERVTEPARIVDGVTVDVVVEVGVDVAAVLEPGAEPIGHRAQAAAGVAASVGVGDGV